MVYTAEEKEALLKFVTSIDDPIYAVRDVPPEIFGALASYFSRNPRDFRDHILDFITGTLTLTEDVSLSDDKKKQRREANLKQFLATYQSPSTVLKTGVDKSRDFFTRWYGKYGHKSIANVVWQGFVCMNQSQLVARQLAGDQLAFFIEMSTRYVDFNNANWYKDPEIMNSEFAELYCQTIEMLIKTYNYFIEHGKEYYKLKYSFSVWKEKQSLEDKQKGDPFLQRKYDREIAAKAFDLSRYLLPQAMPTNFAWILDARSIEFDIAAWKEHPLAEVRDAATFMEKAGGDVLPSLLKHTKHNPYYGDKLQQYQGEFEEDVHTKPQKKQAKILYHHPGALELVLSHLFATTNSITFTDAKKIVQKKTISEKIALLKRLVVNRSRFDEWVDEAFQMVNIGIEWTTDVGAVRDLRRHQKNDRAESIYTLDMGYALPDDVKEMGKEAEDIYTNAMEQVHNAEKKIRQRFPYQVQYIIPMACMTTLRMNIALDQAQYLIFTRSTPEGHPSYRQDSFNLCEEIAKTYPWMLGYEEYPVGKNIFEVYAEAPIQNLLRMRTEDTTLHQ
ncbi:MAG: FAD-dependent thymidylate synthase [Candidatus Woesearchaeota archaeon]|jgi:thymidylate synthase ThyX